LKNHHPLERQKPPAAVLLNHAAWKIGQVGYYLQN
jgi:hypothetical protein